MRMRITSANKFLAAGVCIFGAAACLAQSGQVKADGQPIPAAMVRATQGDRILTTLTDQNGEFHFEGMTPGQWNVEAQMFGFESARKEVQIPGKIELTLQLRARPAARGAGLPTEDVFDAAQMSAAAGDAGAAPQTPIDASNESLLVNGSISQALQASQADVRDMLGGARGGLGPAGPGAPGLPALQLSDGSGAAPAQQSPAVGSAVAAGPAGGFAGRGGGGFGGGGGRGGGFGGRGGRGARGNPAFIGNRRPNNNRITGSFYYQLGNSALNARPFAVNGIPEPKAAYAQNRFGISAGGPLFVPKLFDLSKIFWFVNYQGNRLRNGVDQAFSEPTPLQRAGDFSRTNAIIYDPTTGAPFPNNMIPSSRISPIARGLMSYLPLPNQAVATTNQDYRLIAANPNNTQSLNTRVNTTFTPKDTLALTFNLQQSDQSTFEYFGCCDTIHGQGLNANLNWRRRLGQRNFNNVTLSFNRNTNRAIPFFANGPDVAAMLGIAGASPNPANYGPPALGFANFSALTDTNESRSAIWSYGAADNVQIHKGKHNWNIGGGFTHFLNNTVTDQNGRGSFNFTGLSTAGYNSAGLPLGGTGYDFADFLLGLPESSSIRYGDSSTYYRSNAYNAFLVDDYRVATNLSLNLGLRYEYFTPWREEYGHAANLDIAPNFAAVAPVLPNTNGPLTGAYFPGTLIRPDHGDFGPRLALAWKPSAAGRMLVRAGYGIYYQPNEYNILENQLAAEPPFAITNSVTTSAANVLTLATGLVSIPPGKTVTNSYAAALNYPDAFIQTWNVSIQEELPKRMIAEIMYTGTVATHLTVQQAPNQAPLGSALTGYENLPIANAGNFIFDDPIGRLNMNAMQVRLTRRFQRGVSWNLFYTFSKSLDDVALAQNFYDQRAEYALSPTNRTHMLTANWVLASPVDATRGFLSHPEFVAKALKDWTLSGSVTAETGLPLTATIAGDRDGTASLAPLRADATGLPVTAGSGYFNLAAFAVPPAGTFGTAGRNTIIGPGMFVWNFSLARSINLHSERRRLEIRLDSTNTFNHVNPSGLITIVNSSQYGLITSAGAMRQMSATVRLRF
jgi:hypothetical protein